MRARACVRVRACVGRSVLIFCFLGRSLFIFCPLRRPSHRFCSARRSPLRLCFVGRAPHRLCSAGCGEDEAATTRRQCGDDAERASETMMAEFAALWFRDEGATDDCGEDDEDEGVCMFAQQNIYDLDSSCRARANACFGRAAILYWRS